MLAHIHTIRFCSLRSAPVLLTLRHIEFLLEPARRRSIESQTPSLIFFAIFFFCALPLAPVPPNAHTQILTNTRTLTRTYTSIFTFFSLCSCSSHYRSHRFLLGFARRRSIESQFQSLSFFLNNDLFISFFSLFLLLLLRSFTHTHTPSLSHTHTYTYTSSFVLFNMHLFFLLSVTPTFC